MRFVTVHPYALVPVPAGLITRVIRRLIGGTHFSLALANPSQFSKGKTKYPQKSPAAANFSKLGAVKFNRCNADMCASATSSRRVTWEFLWKNISFPVLSSFTPQLSLRLSCFLIAGACERFREFFQREVRQNINNGIKLFIKYRGRGDFSQNFYFIEIYSQNLRPHHVPASPAASPHVPASQESRGRSVARFIQTFGKYIGIPL